MKQLHNLDPVELMELLKSIQYKTQLTIFQVELTPIDQLSEWIPMIVGFNGFHVTVLLPYNDYEGIAGAYFFNKTIEAADIVKLRLFSGLGDWVEAIYCPWVKNDVGMNLTSGFVSLLIKEIDRITNLLNDKE